MKGYMLTTNGFCAFIWALNCMNAETFGWALVCAALAATGTISVIGVLRNSVPPSTGSS